MQIHELNTFSGIPGNTDFIPIDTGFDTAKISAKKLLEETDNAIDKVDTYKVNKPLDGNNQPTDGNAGQLLRSKGDGSTEWVDEGLPTDEQTAQAISDWLSDHPEATTTVVDGSLTEAKFSNALKLKAIKDYVTPQMFGAVGDGVADDTTAIQDAIDAITESYYTSGVTTKTGTYYSLFFPKGIYKVTGQLTLKEIHSIDFGSAIIISSYSGYLFNSKAYKASYKGGCFICPKAFYFDNNNLDQGNIVLDGMEFKNCDAAIEVHCQSSQFIVKNSKFDTVMNPVIVAASDSMTIERNWFSCPIPLSNESNFKILAGKTVFRNNICTPQVGSNSSATETAWIENTARVLICTDNRFGGESGSRTPINHKSKWTATNEKVLYFTKNQVNVGRDEKSCVRLSTFPNTLIVKDNYAGSLVKWILSVSTVDVSTFNDDLDEIKALYFSKTINDNTFGQVKFRHFQYDIDNNIYQTTEANDNERQNQRELEYWFLLQNYTKRIENNPMLSFTNRTNTYRKQLIDVADTQTGYKTFHLPVYVGEGAKVTISFNPNTLGAAYRQVREFNIYRTMYYDGSVVYKYNVNEITANDYPGNVQGSADVGLYDDNSEYFGASLVGISTDQRLAVKCVGANVGEVNITVKPLFNLTA